MRVGKLPFVLGPGDEEGKYPRIVSQAIVTQMSDQNHLWRTLKEIAGIENPYVQQTHVELKAEFELQKKALMEHHNCELEKTRLEVQQATREATVKQIVSQLTGVDPADLKAGLF